jgi:hypothetical protein
MCARTRRHTDPILKINSSALFWLPRTTTVVTLR